MNKRKQNGSRVRLGRLISQERVVAVVLVAEVAKGAEVKVITLCTLPPHPHDTSLPAFITHNVRMSNTC